MIRAVLDTNAIVSGFLGLRNPANRLGEVLRRGLAGDYVIVLSDPILAEAHGALFGKSYFSRRLSAVEREDYLRSLRTVAKLVTHLDVIPGVAPHRHDDAILATVAASGADWFVTGDRELLAMRVYAGVPFTDPNGVLAVLDAAR